MVNKVGVIGAGNIGFGMCCNLLSAGFTVVAFDIRPDPLEALRKRGAHIAQDPGDVGRQCDVVFSVVLDYAQNLEILQGNTGLIENMDRGKCLFICSTISPAQVRDLADMAAPKGVRLLDCPVSGGIEGAMAGTLTLMVGGDAEALEEHRAVLEAIGRNMFHLGDVGAGEAAKAINNLLVAVHDVATAEALLLAAKSGLDLNRMFDIICSSAGRSWIFEHRAMRMRDRDFKTRGALKILLKDTGIALDTAASHGLILPLVTVARNLFQAGVNQGLGDEDDAAIVKVIEGLANFSLGDYDK